MEKFNWKALVANIESRALGERLVLMVVLALVIVYVWLMFIKDPVSNNKEDIGRMITIENGRLAEQSLLYEQIQNTYTSDPDVSLKERRQELLDATLQVDEQLSELYGQLVLPRQMAQVLTRILQEETDLRLLSIENLTPEILVTAGAGASVPVSGATEEGLVQVHNGEVSLRVYKHGIRMVLQGSYLETIRYLQKLESQETGFFWEELQLEVGDHPVSTIGLTIFTLSSQRGWIGV